MTEEVENLAVTPVPEQEATAAPESVVETPEESNGSGNENKRSVSLNNRR